MGSLSFSFPFCPGMLPPIIAAKSIFDFDSTPPVAIVRPSGLNAMDVTLRPIVPADIAPIMFVIMADMSAMLGIVGIEPGLPPPFIDCAGVDHSGVDCSGVTGSPSSIPDYRAVTISIHAPGCLMPYPRARPGPSSPGSPACDHQN